MLSSMVSCAQEWRLSFWEVACHLIKDVLAASAHIQSLYKNKLMLTNIQLEHISLSAKIPDGPLL